MTKPAPRVSSPKSAPARARPHRSPKRSRPPGRSFADTLGHRETRGLPAPRPASAGRPESAGAEEARAKETRAKTVEAEAQGPERREARSESERHRREPEPLPEGLLHLPPPIVLPPPSSAVGGASTAAWERAEAAAMAEQVLRHVRVGSNGEVRLGLGGVFEGAEIRLRLEGGRVVPTLVAEDPSALAGLAERLERELTERGLDADAVRIERL